MTVVPAATNALARADRALLRVARTAGHTPARERRVRAFSRLGEHAAVWLALGAAGGGLGEPPPPPWAQAPPTPRRPRGHRAPPPVAAAYVATPAVKWGEKRRRPQLDALPPLIATPTQLSFP